MPSGAKKRKAARKKKDNQPNNHSKPSTDSTHTHGNEDVKHHDEIDSDVGDVSSPVSQDHHNRLNPSTEGDEEEIEKKTNLSDLPSTEGSRINKSDVKVGRDFKIAGKSDGKDRSSSSSNSSDDEGHRTKNGGASIVDLSEKSVKAIHNVPIESEQVKVEYLVEGNEKKLNSVEDKVGTSLEKAIVQSVENADTVLDQKVFTMQESGDRLPSPYNGPRASADNGVEREKDSAVTEPLLVPTPCPVEKTSWKSCCGLFEVFSG